jgi:shikimate dehydrogenase
MPQYGLIGYPLGHSFSKRYFTEKFAREGRTDCRYDLFPLEDVAALPGLLQQQRDLRGLNVTIPHKQAVVPLLEALDDTARAIGAVNTIAVRDGRPVRGYNTDAYGFERSLAAWLTGHGIEPGRTPLRAFVLGSGGAARAVRYVLEKLKVDYDVVSRVAARGSALAYDELADRLSAATAPAQRWLWVNTTPLGMYPDVKTCPPLPFDHFSTEHLVYDLVYNPADTLLLQRAAAHGAAVKNGLEMLYLQAERAWEIWQEDL